MIDTETFIAMLVLFSFAVQEKMPLQLKSLTRLFVIYLAQMTLGKHKYICLSRSMGR